MSAQKLNYFLAILLSALWCGLGNVYAGQFWTGLLLALAYGASLLGTVLFYGFVTTPLLWLCGLFLAWYGVRCARLKPKPVKFWLLALPFRRLIVAMTTLLFAALIVFDIHYFKSSMDISADSTHLPSLPDQVVLQPSELTPEEAGMTNFLLNLALQPLEQWEGYFSLDQFGQSALRYKLAFMTYALAQVHYLKLPAFPTPFKQAIDNLIQRMMDKRVWSYWYFENLWGNWKKNPDPVYEMNIMYSGHLANMIGLYELLFNDQKYDHPGAIRFQWDEQTVFEYSHQTLVERIYQQMRDNPYHSIACEPQQVFAMCNDHAALSLLLYDLTHGTRLSEVNRLYLANLDKIFDADDGYLNYPYYYNVKITLPLHLAVGDGWALSLMYPFARERVQKMYPAFVRRHAKWLTDSTATIAGNMVEFMDIGNYEPTTASQLAFGFLLTSEVGDTTLARALWRHALQSYHPRKENHTFYFEKASLLVNSVFLLGKINRPHGLWQLYNRGWDSQHFQHPYLDSVDLDKFMVLQANYFPEKGLTFTLAPWDSTAEGTITIRGLEAGENYVVWENGHRRLSFRAMRDEYSFSVDIATRTHYLIQEKTF